MSIVQIVIYSLIGIGIVACIIALIYTRLIKPNNFGYTSKRKIFEIDYSKLVKKLNSESKVWSYENVSLNLGDEKSKTIILDRLFVTIQNAYVVSNPLENKVIDITVDKNQNIKLVYKNKNLDLPLDINLLLSNFKILRKNTHQSENLLFIIPVLNKNIQSKVINYIHFVNQDSLYEYIKKIESNSNEFEAKEFVEIIESKMKKQPPKRTFMNIKWKNIIS